MIELRRALPFLVFSLLLLVAGCSLLPAATPSARELLAQELRAAEARWASKDISTYRFTLTYSCFCPWTDPLAVTVVDDQVTSVTMNGDAVANAGGLPLLVESAFEQVRSSLDAHEIEAAFDPEFGFPSRVVADPIENAVDEEFSFRITDFVPGEVPPGAGAVRRGAPHARGGGTAEATWDAASGLPRTLFLDRDRNTIDDELWVTIESLVPQG